MSKNIVIVLLVLVVLGGLYFFTQSTNTQPNSPSNSTSAPKNNSNGTFSFSNPKKSAHYETNTPAHGAVLAGAPVNVVIDFNFDLGDGSFISVNKDGIEYGLGETTIDKNKLTMRRPFDLNAPDGVYTVIYTACWPDGSCHDGNFEFAINRNLSDSFRDIRGESEATIKMSEIMFDPIDIVIDKGTKVTWVNDDSEVHYVNTDSHPAHTYHLAQNSKALNEGDTYSYTFDAPGIYPYHCSAHADSMTGSILVQ